MIYLAEIIVLIFVFLVFIGLIIAGIEYDKAHKWGNIYKGGGRDND